MEQLPRSVDAEVTAVVCYPHDDELAPPLVVVGRLGRLDALDTQALFDGRGHTLGDGFRVVEPGLPARHAELNRAMGDEIPLPRLTLRLAHELRKPPRSKLADARDDPARGTQVHVRAVHRVAPAVECDSTAIGEDSVDAEGAQLTLDERLEPGRGDREEVEAIGDRLSRRDSRLRPAISRGTSTHTLRTGTSERRFPERAPEWAAFASDTRAVTPCECRGPAREARWVAQGGTSGTSGRSSVRYPSPPSAPR